jgi:hypothetical protein
VTSNTIGGFLVVSLEETWASNKGIILHLVSLKET